jgi:hypothetical protein
MMSAEILAAMRDLPRAELYEDSHPATAVVLAGCSPGAPGQSRNRKPLCAADP